MKAAVVTAPGKLELIDVPVPKPNDYQALCRMRYAATCTGTDMRLLAGDLPGGAHIPFVLGHESIGEVIQTGCKVRYLKPGDMVSRAGVPKGHVSGLDSLYGAYAQYGLVNDWRAMHADGLPESQWRGYRAQLTAPQGLSPQAAPMMITWRETLSFSKRMGVSPESRLLVIGSGGNGLAFAAHARNMGAACAVIGSAARRERFRSCGVADYTDYRDTDAVALLAKEAGRPGYTHIIDAFGDHKVMNMMLPCLCGGGTLGVYGLADYRSYSLSPFRAQGGFLFHDGSYDEAETHDEVSRLAVAGRLDARNWYDTDHPVPFADIADAFMMLQQRKAVKYLISF